jgi:hypothetical protein
MPRAKLTRTILGALGGAAVLIGVGQVWAALGSH